MPLESPQPILTVHAARLGFDRPVLGPLSLTVPSGGRWALTGPNGAGKSLLLKGLTGQARLHAGRLQLAPGTRVSLLAQDHPRPHLWPMSGRDWLRAMGAEPPRQASVQALIGRRLDRLSGGQWQLLRLAAALSSHADCPASKRLVLLDEPANHLDAEVRNDAIELIAGLADESTLLMTSHDGDLLKMVGVEDHPLLGYVDAQ
jgi:ATPase subunit of ABC transporter with duplicated ATPase domains